MGFIDPVGYSAPAFEAFVGGLVWAQWKPRFIVLHNTGAPSIEQWNKGAKAYSEQIYGYEYMRCRNLNDYYMDEMQWHSGPHLFISPNYIWNTCDLLFDGVHCSCWNHVSLGVEMVGDYSTEAIHPEILDLTVSALAILHKALRLTPKPYTVGSKGLHAHKDCPRDKHDCPGQRVDMEQMRQFVADRMSGGWITETV